MKAPAAGGGTLVGAVEAGGTKFVCAVGTPSSELLREARIETRSPAETVSEVVSFFHPYSPDLAALGVGSFGPVDLRVSSPTYGFITSTPKTAWRNFDIAGALRDALHLPVGFDTDVNAAVLAEATWGAGQDLENVLYVTVGTGIGGGAMIEGRLVHGLMHPEMGHIRVPHDRERDPFPGVCPYHGDCLEGLASGPSLEARWGALPEKLSPDHPAWILEAEYLGIACMNWICAFSPERIILGGGVMQPHLFPALRNRTRSALNGYIDLPEVTQRIESYIVPPGLGERAGVLGALALGARAAGLLCGKALESTSL